MGLKLKGFIIGLPARSGMCALVAATAVCVFPLIALAEGTEGAGQAGKQDVSGPQSIEDLRTLSIEDLGNLQVTSVSKRPETLRQVAAALYVITSDDIRRSGATSLPEVLRLAPNLEVARINGYSATITARGFNSPETANKLLVLVDGRSVYEPIGSGVLWQQIDVALDNIDRIEVISGPGGTMWGANAVNGVINIITKNSARTQGLYARVASGIYKRSATIRYGGRLGGSATYRVFLDGFKSDSTHAASPSTPPDGFAGIHGGIAIDGERDASTYTFKSDFYDNTIADGGGSFSGYDILGGWVRTLGNGSVFAVQAYVDHDVRDEPTLYETRDTLNIDAQHTVALGARHQFVWGGEMRQWKENFISFNDFHFDDPKTTISLGSLFAQDEITLRRGLKLTLGLKAETNSYSGAAWLPNVRLAWERGNGDLFWGSVARAVRTPNRIERELEHPVFLVPSPNFQSETLTAYELGWRGQPTARSSFSLAAFYNVYDDLRTDGITPVTVVPLMLENGGRGTTYGLEGWGKVEVTPAWRLSAGFNVLRKDFEVKPGYFDLTNMSVQGQDPGYQAQVRSEWNITRAVDFDVTVRTVGKVDNAPVPAYTEASVHIGWRIRDNVELAINGVNLMHKRHLEVWDPSYATPRYVGRSVVVALHYGF